jgi:hypothetical protein
LLFVIPEVSSSKPRLTRSKRAGLHPHCECDCGPWIASAKAHCLPLQGMKIIASCVTQTKHC